MKNYQFRTNWLGQLVLQHLVKYRDQWGGPEFEWHDANTQDLQDYYVQLYRLTQCAQTPTQRELFEQQCG